MPGRYNGRTIKALLQRPTFVVDNLRAKMLISIDINAISTSRRTLLEGIKDASLSMKEESYLSDYLLEGYFLSGIIESYYYVCRRLR